MKRSRQTGRSAQRGAVTLIAVVLLITVITFSALVAALYSGSNVIDTLQQDDSIAALFLAESGMESAMRNLSASGICDNANVGAAGAQAFGRGAFQIMSGTPVASLCRIVARGTIGSVTRTVQADVTMGGGNIAALTSPTSPPWSGFNSNSISWPYNVPATGSNRLLVVSIAWRADAGQTLSFVRYNGVNMTLAAGPASRTSGGTTVRTAAYYLVNPATGANNVTVGLSASTRLVVGAKAFSGVDQTNPLDNTAATANGPGNSPQPSISVTTVTANAWVFSAGSVVGGNVLTATNGTQVWGPNAQTGGGGPHAEGAASYRGPIATPGAASMTWNLGVNDIWALVAFPIRGAGGVQISSWTEI